MMRAKPVGRMRKRRRRRIIPQTRPSPSSTSRMRIRCLVRIRYNECTVALKAGEDNHRHETLDDERLALRTLDSQKPAIMMDPRYRKHRGRLDCPPTQLSLYPPATPVESSIYKRPPGVVLSTGSCRSLCRKQIRLCRENLSFFLSFLLLRVRSAPYFSFWLFSGTGYHESSLPHRLGVSDMKMIKLWQLPSLES